MAAVGLAIIGKNNSPLYVREFLSELDTEDEHDEGVLFGLKPLIAQDIPEASSRCWFILHAALDRLEQLTEALDGKKKAIPANNFVGLLLASGEARVYGYLTNTQTKFLMVVEDEGPNEAEGTAAEIKQLFVEIHELYIREVMNPFNSTSKESNGSDSNRLSRAFDQRIQKHVTNYNHPPETRDYVGMAEC
jgi:hypothetical protein